MIRSLFRIALVTVIALSVAVAQSKPSAQKKADATKKTAARAAQVTYTGGQLSVVANENSLAETLAEIRELTKARVEGVQPGPSEKISGEFGPDTPRSVVSALLASSHYNFILLSPPGSPGSLQRIVLSEPAPEPVATAAPVGVPAMPESTPAAQPADNDHQSDTARKEDGEHRDAAATEKETSDFATELAPEKEAKPESGTPSASSDPNPNKDGNQLNVPPTVEICGVTYTAAQLADLRVPDHCGKPAQQPNSTAGSKQSN